MGGRPVVRYRDTMGVNSVNLMLLLFPQKPNSSPDQPHPRRIRAINGVWHQMAREFPANAG